MFEIGARVRTRAQRTGGHTRLPRYLEQRTGCVVDVLGDFRFADEASEHGIAASKQTLYTVEFEYGSHRVRADLFESYLENAP